MAFRPFTIDEGIISDGEKRSGNLVKVTEGEYTAVIKTYKPAPEDWDKAYYYDFGCELRSGYADGIGKTLRFRVTMQEAREKGSPLQYGLGPLLAVTGNGSAAEQLLAAAKKKGEAGKLFVEDYDQFVRLGQQIFNAVKDKEIGVLVGDFSYNGSTYSDVKNVFWAKDVVPPLTSHNNGAPSANAVGADAAKDDAFTSSVDSLFGGSPTI